MASIVKRLRPRIVVPICVGSNPTTRPIIKISTLLGCVFICVYFFEQFALYGQFATNPQLPHYYYILAVGSISKIDFANCSIRDFFCSFFLQLFLVSNSVIAEKHKQFALYGQFAKINKVTFEIFIFQKSPSKSIIINVLT